MIPPRGSWHFALLVAALGACARGGAERSAVTSPGAMPGAVAARAERVELALPSGADRCLAVLPSRLSERDRALAALVSQSEELPWVVGFGLEAYAKAERTRPDGRRASVEIFRFREGERGPLERELARALAQPIAWEERVPDPRLVCEGELTCSPLRGRFVAARTVRLMRGEWGDEEAGAPDACAPLLESHRDAFEVGARTLSQASEQVRSELSIRRDGEGFVREMVRRYPDPGSAERALQSALLGHDELPVFAGVTASSFGQRRGASIEQRSSVSLDELTLALAGRERSARVEREERQPAPSDVDPRDTERVKAAFDGVRDKLSTLGAPRREALELDRLLADARAHAPDDEGLLRRHYELTREGLAEPRAALAIAEQALRERRGDERAWQLRLRAALARCDEARLAEELARAHALPKSVAARMATELAERARTGGDHERAEWAFLTARRLAHDAARIPRAPLTERLPLAELGRLFGYLGRAARGADIGVQLLVMGKLRERAADSSEAPWSALTAGGGRTGLVISATTWDEAQLAALGRALLASSEHGPLEIFVSLEELEGTRRNTLALSGARSGDQLELESASRALARLPWARVERLLLAPLASLTGNTFPPDALVVQASDDEERARIARAGEEEARVRCTSEGEVVSCRGGLADPGAAARALRQVVRALLSGEARALWSSHE